jgi:hypothetical protein
MATVIPGSVQSNRDRAELVALQRLGTVEDCAKVVEFLATHRRGDPHPWDQGDREVALNLVLADLIDAAGGPRDDLPMKLLG